MREIKFRVWDYVNEMMFYPDDMRDFQVIKTNGQFCSVTDEGLLIEQEGYLMEYTGLKDKNGNEIFEGDILKYSIQGDMQTNPIIVDHENLIIGLNHDDSYYSMDEESFEIIGNIYENPKLMKEAIK